VSNLNSAIVLAAGFGKRMNSSTPKVLHPICGVPMLGHVLNTVQQLKPSQIITVVGHGKERVTKYLNSEFKKVKTAVQKQQNGTGHAVQVALAELKSAKGLVLIMAADTPLLSAKTIS
jgi:bifunctional UDP-N-acetylglucosamine pyrophosphorylase/glucosamine-1-phosphate N-acetyltransferase